MKRIYVPLPEAQTRFQLISQLVTKQEQSCGRRSKLSESSLKKIVNKTQGYSASDLTAVLYQVLTLFFFNMKYSCAKRQPWDRLEKFHPRSSPLLK